MNQISVDTNWTPLFFTIEAGVCGFVARSVEHTLLRLGISRRIFSKVCKNLSLIAARCSFAIYQSANSIHWEKNRNLISIDP